MGYVNVDFEIIKDVGDLVEANILCFLLNQDRQTEKIKSQKWQQTKLSELFCMDRRKIKKVLDCLTEKGYINYERDETKWSKTTKITLTEKAIQYKQKGKANEFTEMPKHIVIRKTTTTHTPSNNISLADNKIKPMTMQEKYLNIVNNNFN